MNMLEYVKRVEGHKNSKGEPAPWTIVSHETGKIISSHKTKKAAEEHLKWMEIYKRKANWKKKAKTESAMGEPNMDKKYELTGETMEFEGRTLYRIRALRTFYEKYDRSDRRMQYFDDLSDIYDVVEGDLGGWIESEGNLSQKGDCWVFDEAKVYDHACVIDNATVYMGAEVGGYATISGNAHIGGYVRIIHDVSDETIFKEPKTEADIAYEEWLDSLPIEDDTYEDNMQDLFAESVSKLGLNKAQLEAVMRIHDIAYGKTLQEGRISNALGAGALAAMMATSPANAQNPSEYYDRGAEVTSIEEPDALPDEQIQEINEKNADKYLNWIKSTKPWNGVDEDVNTGDYKYTIRPIKEIDDAAGKIREKMRMLLDINIDIDEQLKEKDIEHLDKSLEEWKRDLLENMNSLVGRSMDTVECRNTFGIGYADDPEKADEIAIKDAIKTFKDRRPIQHGYKLVVYPDFARKIIHLPDGIGEGYVKYVTGVVVHTVPDSEYLGVPEYLRVGNISELPTTR